jgi:hypothetical protein
MSASQRQQQVQLGSYKHICRPFIMLKDMSVFGYCRARAV